MIAFVTAENAESTCWRSFVVRHEESNSRVLRVCSCNTGHNGMKQGWPNSARIAAFVESCRAQGGLQEEHAACLTHISVWNNFRSMFGVEKHFRAGRIIFNSGRLPRGVRLN